MWLAWILLAIALCDVMSVDKTPLIVMTGSTTARPLWMKTGPVKLWEGVMMSAYSRALADWEGSGYGPMLSVPQHTMGIFAAMLQWEVHW